MYKYKAVWLVASETGTVYFLYSSVVRVDLNPLIGCPLEPCIAQACNFDVGSS
jgi:hypothetical protein